MDDDIATSNNINSESAASDNCIVSSTCTSGAERYSPREILENLFNSNNEESSVFLLSILLMASGLILFIYGLISGKPYQFIMAFFFLVPGLVLDDVRQQQMCER